MIFSLMIFPGDAGITPVFGAEFVVFGRLLRAAVVDVQPLTPAARNEASYLRLVERLAGRWPELMATGPMPEWCEAHFTAHAVFVLRESATLLEPAHEAFDDYMAAYADLLARQQQGSSAEGDAELRHYKDHHIANTPGRRYLTRLFGEDWTEWFLRERMYAD